MFDLSQLAEKITASGCPTFASAEEGPGEIRRVSAIFSATPNAVVFASDEKTLDTALRSAAGAILTRPTLANNITDPRILLTKDPRLAFAYAARHLSAPVQAGIHPTAIVHESVILGARVSIGAYAILEARVTLGDDCVIAPRVTIHADTTLGARCMIQSGAVLGSLGFGYARSSSGSYTLFPQQGTLTLEDDVEVGANTTIDRGALEETRIGSGTKIDNLVHIGHNCRIGKNVVIAAQTGISGSSVIEDGAILGGQVGIGEKATVGPNVILGGGAGVLSNKKLHGPGQVFWGRPAQPLKQYLRDLAKLRKD
ncbi:UDP-3-O-(3-hydroxymyristoyl)glucosamine N-acyltransferase [Terriglobus tenax]|uniref:UDP-3-O-(3-hydroxymyristoyl)glucosamine N-acyltransferase n=1 Tax=Terriglobus tenax TaxID=1111115 RepID=UPI0021E0B799|nr:UDP-3-O-(3-hydroxymyristoyl)glucosamine N-acyltransferase [Terriglobus tenax]